MLRSARVALPLHECALHRRCTLDRRLAPTACCAYCPDHEGPPLPPAPALLLGLVDPLNVMPVANPNAAWGAKPKVRAEHLRSLEVIMKLPAPALEVKAPCGIVTMGGGRYWPMVRAALRMARRYTDVPIRAYYRGAEDAVVPGDVAELRDVELIDLAALGPHRRPGAWELKARAILEAPFERVIWLDADAYLVGNPADLFALVSAEQPLAYWRDAPNHETSVNWEWWGRPAATRFPSVQGGQIVFHRLAAARELLLAHWLNQHSEYSYLCGYGDQDQWRVAWQRTGAGYVDLGRARVDGPAFVCELEGKPYVVHRTGAKWWGLDTDQRADQLPEEDEAWLCRTDVQRRTATRDSLTEQPQLATWSAVYDSGLWGPGRTSGRGSDHDEARPYLELVAGLAVVAGWTTAVDLGCGDGRVALALPFGSVHGVDVDVRHVDALTVRAPNRQWSCLDLDGDRDRLPSASVALLKDVLHHWPTALVRDWLQWARRCRKWRALLVTFDHPNATAGADCELGAYRPLSPELAPLADLGLRRVATYLHKTVCLAPVTP